MIRMTATIILAVLLAGCNKKDAPKVYLSERYPQYVILVTDNENDPLYYEYLSASSSVVRRVKVDKKDDAVEALYNSSHARECVWIAQLQGNALFFQLASDTGVYLKAVANRANNTEYMLWASTGKGAANEYLFDSHHISLQNSVKITTMESVLYPQLFFSHEGVVTEGNAVKLNLHTDPATAVKVRWYSRIM